jgi:hypothetical protein
MKPSLFPVQFNYKEEIDLTVLTYFVIDKNPKRAALKTAHLQYHLYYCASIQNNQTTS